MTQLASPAIDEEPSHQHRPRLLYSSVDSSPTLRVCEAMYFDSDLRRRTLDALVRQRHRSWAPNYHLDTTAILRHAGRAQRWQLYRDAAFCSVLFGLVAAAWLGLFTGNGLALVTLAALPAAVTPPIRSIARRRKITWKVLRKWLRSNPRYAMVATAAIALTLGYVTVAVRSIEVSDVYIIAGCVVLIIAIGLVDAAAVTTWALRCSDGGSVLPGQLPLLRQRAPLLTTAAERRLSNVEDGPEPDQSQMDEGAVIVYNFESRRRTNFIDNVFVGSGESLGGALINVDVNKGKLKADGTRMEPQRVFLADMHRTVERVAREAAEPGFWCGYRMYVDERSLHQPSSLNADLLPNPHDGPRSRLPLHLLMRYLLEPTAYERTHLCVQAPITRWNGEIVVTLFMRADLTASVLTVHSHVLILPGSHLRDLPDDYPTDRWTFVKRVLRVGALAVWRPFVQSPGRLAGDIRASLRHRRYQMSVRSGIKHHKRLRHGSVCSIREELARGGRIVHPNAIDDISQTVANLLHTLKAGLRTYLDERDIDTAPLDDEVRNVINNQNTKIEQLHAKNVAFGEQSQAGDTNQSQNPPPAQT